MKSADGSISASMMSWMVAVGRKPASDAVCCEQAPSPSSSAKGKKIFVCIARRFLAGPRHIRTGEGNPYTKHSGQGKQRRRDGPPPGIVTSVGTESIGEYGMESLEFFGGAHGFLEQGCSIGVAVGAERAGRRERATAGRHPAGATHRFMEKPDRKLQPCVFQGRGPHQDGAWRKRPCRNGGRQ